MSLANVSLRYAAAVAADHHVWWSKTSKNTDRHGRGSHEEEKPTDQGEIASDAWACYARAPSFMCPFIFPFFLECCFPRHSASFSTTYVVSIPVLIFFFSTASLTPNPPIPRKTCRPSNTHTHTPLTQGDRIRLPDGRSNDAQNVR